MQKLDDWRELLGKIINHNPTERERIANELGVRSITLTRWANGESVPRSYYLRELVNVLPQQDRALLSESLEQEFPGVLSALSPDDPSGELPYQIVDEVLTTRATNPDPLRFWAMSRLVLQHALRQLDPECMGMAITLVRCMPPFRDGKIHSLREDVGLGTPPWGNDPEQKALFLGAESLAGYAVSSGRSLAIQDLTRDQPFLPAYQGEYEVSAAGFPIFYASRIAGCLLLSSTQPNYFLPPSRPSLIQGYTNLVALAFEPEDFYPHTLVDLRVMPPLHVQQTYFAGFRQRVRKRMQESLTTQHPLKLTLAERLVWQELEEIFLQLPHPAT